MEDSKLLLAVIALLLLAVFGAAAVLKGSELEDCKQRGGQVVRVDGAGSEYECEGAQVK